MRELPNSIGHVAWLRIAESADPERFKGCMLRALVAESQGADLATAAWTAADPVKTAAEIEVLAALRTRRVSLEDLR
ncbi:hypothetical protein ACFWH1_18815 [Streptomyces sp. NPDC127037]|uniref:hypothetical protein n=1 Tax=Streptomyces sp. NPDC127037 TaxID=3347113 RepID=UPI00365A7335